MNGMDRLVRAFERIHASDSEPVRTRVRRAPVCESLEGRQLLNGAWSGPQGLPMWAGAGQDRDRDLPGTCTSST